MKCSAHKYHNKNRCHGNGNQSNCLQGLKNKTLLDLEIKKFTIHNVLIVQSIYLVWFTGKSKFLGNVKSIGSTIDPSGTPWLTSACGEE